MQQILFPAAFLGLVVVLVVLFVQRRESLDLSPRGLLRAYLYQASLAGIVTLALGLGSLANFGLAAAFGDQLVYGGSRERPLPTKCPPGEPRCVEPPPEAQEQARRAQLSERERRRSEDLLRGLTFTGFGALFWGAHRAARGGVLGPEERGSGLRRAYLMLGAGLFGLVAIIMLPTGIYQALSYLVVPAPEFTSRQGADSMGGGIAAVPIWLLFVRQIVRDVRDAPAVS